MAADAATSADELMAFVAERVAPYKKVRQVEFVDAIPKSASGKILRRELIERERARGGAQPEQLGRSFSSARAQPRTIWAATDSARKTQALRLAEPVAGNLCLSVPICG